jgi:hypothetical protein
MIFTVAIVREKRLEQDVSSGKQPSFVNAFKIMESLQSLRFDRLIPPINCHEICKMI